MKREWKKRNILSWKSSRNNPRNPGMHSAFEYVFQQITSHQTHTHMHSTHICMLTHACTDTGRWVTVTANDMTGTVPYALLDIRGAHKCINWRLLFFSFSR